MSVYEGTTCTITEEFFDEFDDPVIPTENTPAPFVRLFDTDKSVIAEVYAKPYTTKPGHWIADLPIPNMDLRDAVELVAKWSFESDTGRYQSTTKILVEPATLGRESDIVVICGRDTRMQVTVPITYKPPVAPIKANLARGIAAKEGKPGDKLTVSLFDNNKTVFNDWDVEDQAIKVESMKKRTVIDMPAIMGTPQMAPLTMLVDHTPKRKLAKTTLTYKVWAITPQILMASRQLEDYINRARVANIIPELEYTQSDIMEYLARGLSFFNGLQPNITNFTGTNMQGPLMDAWLTCSCIYALGSQNLAEGSLAFDFGGQTVSLNVDRTPALESALGRIDAQIESQVKPLKKLLGRAGVLGGDGSAGGSFIDSSRAFGILGISNTPMTRLPGYAGRGQQAGGFFRNFF
uniref:Head-tail connector protein n=1 Tax=Pseudomonas phage HRDY3 TaxID=3236930 RepID=A0AB39CEC1_9VIRU